MVELNRPHDSLVWRMCFAHWITKATYTHSICNTYCFSTATLVTRSCLSLTFLLHCLSCFTLQNENSDVPYFLIHELHTHTVPSVGRYDNDMLAFYSEWKRNIKYKKLAGCDMVNRTFYFLC
jgi:hypothetical protein